MGASKKNYYLHLHDQVDNNGALEPQGLSLRVHQGSLSLDVVLAECSAVQRVHLVIDAGLSQADFDAAAGGIWGNPYSSLDAADKAALRAMVAAYG